MYKLSRNCLRKLCFYLGGWFFGVGLPLHDYRVFWKVSKKVTSENTNNFQGKKSSLKRCLGKRFRFGFGCDFASALRLQIAAIWASKDEKFKGR